ncbi:hypothetical protein ATANTOWER_022300 [Ataeniobius toweri]|uniref:Uncharacterized protein n=1 Tax=Ataeniobius toweri TaxID=208326 RepID=A0ABU7B114_9TELE|nr:hypothetical protein [Ataeniobius toweri]
MGSAADHQGSSGSCTVLQSPICGCNRLPRHSPELLRGSSTLLGLQRRPPSRPPVLCVCLGRTPGHLPQLGFVLFLGFSLLLRTSPPTRVECFEFCFCWTFLFEWCLESTLKGGGA